MTGLKLVLWARTSPFSIMLRSCKWFTHVNKMSPLAYNLCNLVTHWFLCFIFKRITFEVIRYLNLFWRCIYKYVYVFINCYKNRLCFGSMFTFSLIFIKYRSTATTIRTSVLLVYIFCITIHERTFRSRTW